MSLCAHSHKVTILQIQQIIHKLSTVTSWYLKPLTQSKKKKIQQCECLFIKVNRACVRFFTRLRIYSTD